jgi:predicted signal transduction protein with EAL and GGDEF domain
MRAIFAEATTLPACVQDSAAEPPPEPLSACGVTSHYVLPVGTPPFGVLALMHTEARPRGFTSLCREVGLRLAQSAEPLLRSALTLHSLEAQLDRVGRDARIDPLTKLPNRRAWDEAVAGRAPGEPAGVIVVDADRLKAVNDERGHHVGDEYLQLVAQTVAANLRDRDILAR